MANVITLEGGDVVISASLDGGDIYPSGGGGGGNLQAKSVSYTPTEVSVSDHLTPSAGYDGFSYVDVSIDGISPTYIGSAIPLRNSSDLSAAGATVTAPAGFYNGDATKTIADASTPYGGLAGINSSGDVTFEMEIDTGGYIGAGTYSVTDSGAVTVQAAQTIYPSASDQSIASGKYLTGAQTIKGVTYSGLDAGNIKKDVVVKIGDSSDDDRILSVTGTYEGGGGGITLDQILTRAVTGDVVINIPQQPFNSSLMSDFYGMFRKNKISSIKSTGLPWVPPHFVDMEGTTNDLTNRPLTSVEMDAEYCGSGAFKNCSNLTTVKLYNLTIGYYNYTNISGSMFENCTSLTTVAFPKLTRIGGTFMKGCTSLTAVDFGALVTIDGQNHFQNCSAMNVLIIRTSSVATLATINTFENTPFASGKAGGTLYVPDSLKSQYTSASNWSTILGYATNSIASIEGSAYEHYYADGTAIPTP